MATPAFIDFAVQFHTFSELDARPNAIKRLYELASNTSTAPTNVGKIYAKVVRDNAEQDRELVFLNWEDIMDLLSQEDAPETWRGTARTWLDKIPSQRKAAGLAVLERKWDDLEPLAAVNGGGGGVQKAVRGGASAGARRQLPKLPEYHGDKGQCGEWWSAVQEVFSALDVTEAEQLACWRQR